MVGIVDIGISLFCGLSLVRSLKLRNVGLGLDILTSFTSLLSVMTFARNIPSVQYGQLSS